MDFPSLYDKISYEVKEKVQMPFQKIQKKENKSITSLFIKNLTLMILRSNAFEFCNIFCRQLTGTAISIDVRTFFVAIKLK